MKYHEPVLLKPSVDALNVSEGGVYVDLTFGGGGHSREILSRFSEGRLLAFDQDKDAMANVPDDERFCFVRSNFRYVSNFLRYYNVLPVDGVIADLGISSWQIDAAERGFSFRYDAPLDMRMNRESEKTAADLLNDLPAEELLRVFRTYGELKSPVSFVKSIMAERKNTRIETTGQLADIAQKHVPANRRNKFLAQVFQALRIELNQEMQVLEEMLLQMADVIKPGGRLVVLSYHSLEDRMVKNLIRSGNLEGRVEKDFYGNPLTPFEAVNRKPILADEKEMEKNSRARSVRMRVAIRK